MGSDSRQAGLSDPPEKFSAAQITRRRRIEKLGGEIMAYIIKMEYTESVRTIGHRLGQLGDNLIQAQAEIYSEARGMDWDGSVKDNFVQDVETWAGKMRALSTRCGEKSYAVLKEEEEWEAAANAFVKGYTPFIKAAGDSSAADKSDIIQGDIGDCFLMSSMGAIALQHPELIEKMIHDNGDGTYTVTFYDAHCQTPLGPCTYTPHYVTVDGNYPDELANPEDTVGGTQESWTMILEKAYLKWQKENGSNPFLDLQSPSVALSAMTGKDCNNYYNPQISMADLYKSFQRGDAITAGSRWSIDPTHPDFFGPPDNMPEGHVFFVTAVDPVNNTVTVQNPWGPGHDPYILTMSFEDYQKNFWLTTTNPVV
jgi:hypothetical protein